MADFNKAFESVIFNEGGYVNDPDDAGGETYMGISRKHHPNSLIWFIVDKVTAKYKKVSDINRELKKDGELTVLVKAIYKSDYWNPFNLSKEKSQKLANQIFDSAVNTGVAKTKQLLQRVKNEMEMFKKLYNIFTINNNIVIRTIYM